MSSSTCLFFATLDLGLDIDKKWFDFDEEHGQIRLKILKVFKM